MGERETGRGERPSASGGPTSNFEPKPNHPAEGEGEGPHEPTPSPTGRGTSAKADGVRDRRSRHYPMTPHTGPLSASAVTERIGKHGSTESRAPAYSRARRSLALPLAHQPHGGSAFVRYGELRRTSPVSSIEYRVSSICLRARLRLTGRASRAERTLGRGKVDTGRAGYYNRWGLAEVRREESPGLHRVQAAGCAAFTI